MSEEQPSSDPSSPPAKAWYLRHRYLQIAVAVILVAVLLRGIDWRKLVQTMTTLQVGWAIGFALLAVFRRLVRAYKWRMLLSCRGIHIGIWESISLIFIGHFLGSVTPGGIGCDAYRIAALRHRQRTETVVASVIIERYFGLLMFTLVGAIALPWSLPYIPAQVRIWLMLALLGLLAALLILPAAANLTWLQSTRWGSQLPKLSSLTTRLQEFHNALREYQREPATLFAFALLTIGEVFVQLAGNQLAVWAVQAHVPPTAIVGLMPLVHVLLRMPIAFEGIGVQEFSLGAVLQLTGNTTEAGIAVSLLHRFVELVCSIAPGVGMLWYRLFWKAETAPAAATTPPLAADAPSAAPTGRTAPASADSPSE